MSIEAMKLALDLATMHHTDLQYAETRSKVRTSIRQAIEQAQKQEPVAWISVKDDLPKAVRGVSYGRYLTDVVLVRHSDRPDYPITAHAVVGQGLGAGIAIWTNGASEHPEIAWYSQCRDLNNPFDLKNDNYERYLPKVFGSKITHWKPIDATAPPPRPWIELTDEEISEFDVDPVEAKLMIAKIRSKNT
jgi:hypothetical protein